MPSPPERKRLPHDVPSWVDPSREVWFVTIVTQPRGVNQLARGDRWPGIVDALENRHARLMWWAHVFLAMPDHCHLLLRLPVESAGLGKVVTDFKHWLASRLKIEWQRGFFDHRLRHEESFAEKAAYIRANPVRAGLAEREEDWPYVWSPADAGFTGLHR